MIGWLCVLLVAVYLIHSAMKDWRNWHNGTFWDDQTD